MPRKMKKKNVIIFFTDQQRFDTMGLHGNPMGLTPNLDRAALEGTHCYNTFTPQPVCLPARSCLQTGEYTSQVGCDTNLSALPDNEKTLAHYFNKAGYETGYIGKWHLNTYSRKPLSGPQGGYKYWLAENTLEDGTDAYDTVLHDEKGRPKRLPGYRVDALTDARIRFVDKNKARPFFLMVSYLEPHFQNHRDDYPTPYGYEDMYNDPWTPADLKALNGSAHRHLPGYYGMVKRLDEAYGRMLDSLRSLGLLESTIELFTSDHGCHFRTRNYEYKRSCHDASIRVPMVFSGGSFLSGGRLRELISLIDIPPTLLDACGLKVPKGMMGRSILPLLKGEREDWPTDVYAEISEDHVGRVIRTARWKYSLRLTKENEYTEDCLYDLMADPHELNDLAGKISHDGLVKVLRKRLVARMEEAGQERPTIKRARKRHPGQKRVDKKEYWL